MKKSYILTLAVAIGWFLLLLIFGGNKTYFYVAPKAMTAKMSDRSAQEQMEYCKQNNVVCTEDLLSLEIEAGYFWQVAEKAGKKISFYDEGTEYLIPSAELTLVTQEYIDELEDMNARDRTKYQEKLIYKWNNAPKDKRIIWLMLLPLVAIGFMAFYVRSIIKETISDEQLPELLSTVHLSLFMVVVEVILLGCGGLCFGWEGANIINYLLSSKASMLGYGWLFAIVFTLVALVNIILCYFINKGLLKATKVKFSWKSLLIAFGVMMAAAIVIAGIASSIGIETKGNWGITAMCIGVALIYLLYDMVKNSPNMVKIFPLLLISTAVMVYSAYILSFAVLIIAILVAFLRAAPILHALAQSGTSSGGSSNRVCRNCIYYNSAIGSCSVNNTITNPNASCSAFRE